MAKKSGSRWSDPKTVKKAAEEREIDPREFGKDLLEKGQALEVYGTQITNDSDADRGFKRKIKEADEKRKLSQNGPRLKLAKVGKSRSGVLDGQIARAVIHSPKIERKIADIEMKLLDDNLPEYKRGRLELKLKNLKSRLNTHAENSNISAERLNELFPYTG